MWVRPLNKTYVCLSGDFSSTDRNALVKHHNKRHKDWNKMAYDFNEEDKSVEDMAERMPFGVNRVELLEAIAGVTDAGKDYIELKVANDTGMEDSARVWFVGGASKYSFATLRQIAVHHAKDADKEKARMAVENCKNSDDLAALLNKMVIGGELWLTKYYDPINTYEREGNTYRSINKNLYGYEPKLKPELLDAPKAGNAGDAVTDAFPGATAEASDAIPSDDAWGK